MRHWRELCLITLYFLTRLAHLTRIPIFNDESTYVRYGLHQVMEPRHEFYSLLIGKEPLVPYLFAQFGLLFHNPLLGARLVSVIFGFLTFLGIYYTAKLVRDKKVAYIASLFYILAPFTLFFDRLALLDSAVSAIEIWALYLVFKIIKKPFWYHSLLLGIVLGLGMWIKTSVAFFLILAPFSILFFTYFNRKDSKRKIKFVFTSLGIALLVFSLLYFNPLYAVHRQLLAQYVYPPTSVFQFMLDVYFSNFSKIFIYLLLLTTPPIFLLALYSLKNWKDTKLQVILLWLALPLLYMTLFSKLLTSRHALLLSVPLILLASYSVFNLKTRLKHVVISFTLFWMLVIDIFLFIAPQQFPNIFFGYAKDDMSQYFHGFSSGYGVEEAMDYLKDKAEQSNITVAIRNDTGNPEDAITAYLYYDPRVKIIPFNDKNTLFDTLKNVDTDVYFVSRGPQYAGLEKYLEEEKIFHKPGDTEFVGVYRLSMEH